MGYFFNTKTHEVRLDQSVNESHINSDCTLFFDTYFHVLTRFLGSDMREYLDLSHIKEPLVFSTSVNQGPNKGSRAFWSTYEQAELGHEYFVMRQKVEKAHTTVARIREEEGLGFQLTDRHHDISRALADLGVAGYEIEITLQRLIKPIGVSEVNDLTRHADYVPIKSREPIVLPAEGYESDIERYIEL